MANEAAEIPDDTNLTEKKIRGNLPSWKVRRLKKGGIGSLLQQLRPADESPPVKVHDGDNTEASSEKRAGELPHKCGTGNESAFSERKSSPPSVVSPAETAGKRSTGTDQTSGGGGKRRRQVEMPAEIRQSPELAKYWYQRHRLFSRFDSGVRLSGAAWFSVTPERIARHLADRCRCDVIVDAFCGAGGNAIQFAATCRLVIAVDISPEQVALACHNAAVYGVRHRIQFVVGDFFQLAPKLRADAVFLAPPWGGPQYCDTAVYDMYRLDGSVDGRQMMAAARMVSDNIGLLAPRNANSEQLAELAGPGGQVEVEQNLLNGRPKTITAYYGGFVGGGGGG